MGDTLRYAEKMNLIEMEPRGDLTSTGFALANPGREYLILQPRSTPEAFTVTVEARTYTIEWFSVEERKTQHAAEITAASSGDLTFRPPFAAGPAVLYLETSRLMKSHVDFGDVLFDV